MTRWGQKGSLTSFAKQVFLADVQVEVFNTEFAVLDVGFLLHSVAVVVDGALSLLGRVVIAHGHVL